MAPPDATILYDQDLAYPFCGRPFLEVWAGRFEAVFVLLHPFARIEGKNPFLDGQTVSPLAKGASAKAAYARAAEAGSGLGEGLEVLTEGARLLYQGTPLDQADLADDDIVRIVPWTHVAQGAGLQTRDRLYAALLAVIGALRKPRLGDSERLIAHAEAEGLFLPSEGYFQPLHGPALRGWFEALGCEQVIYQPEFDIDPCVIIPTKDLADDISMRGSLYDSEGRSLVLVDWDSFFTLVGGNRLALECWRQTWAVDGFMADSSTTHEWWLSALDEPVEKP